MRIARMSASFLGSNLARTAIGFVTSLVIGRGLGPGEFGRWIFFTAWASALTVAFDLGLSTLVTRDAARDEGGVGGLVAVRLAVFAPAGALVYTGASWIGGGPASADPLRVAVWLAAAGLAYGCFAALFRASPRWLIAILTIETAGAALQCGGALLIRVNHLKRAIPPQRARKRRVLPRQSPWTSEIVNRCAEQGIAAWLLVIPQGEHDDLVPPRQPLDEPQQSRGDALASAAIDAAGYDERDPHHADPTLEHRRSSRDRNARGPCGAARRRSCVIH
jgi:hypothetical protein